MFMPFILALGRQRQADLCEFKASLVYRVSSRSARATQGDLFQKQTNKHKLKISLKQRNQCAECDELFV